METGKSKKNSQFSGDVEFSGEFCFFAKTIFAVIDTEFSMILRFSSKETLFISVASFFNWDLFSQKKSS